MRTCKGLGRKLAAKAESPTKRMKPFSLLSWLSRRQRHTRPLRKDVSEGAGSSALNYYAKNSGDGVRTFSSP